MTKLFHLQATRLAWDGYQNLHRLSSYLQAAMTTELSPSKTVFVEHFEQRRPVGKNAKKLPASNFYLRDSLGRQHLAAQADAHGDAHYT